MPEMNGLELQEKLNEMELSIPIIFMTGHGGIPESVKAIKAGAIDFLEKPFDFKQLKMRINMHLTKRFSALKAKELYLKAQEKGEYMAKYGLQDLAKLSKQAEGQ